MQVKAIVFGTIGVAALSAAAFAGAGVVAVSQQNRAFAVPGLRIVSGQTLHVTNDDRFRHQIYVDSPSLTFESDETDPGSSVDIAFPKAGLFEVRCHIHPKMRLAVDVEPSP